MAAIDEALEALQSQKFPNYTKTAEDFGVDRTTLSRRHRQITQSRQDYKESKSRLTNQQSKCLIDYINKLTNRGIPPTPSMVRNFVKDITNERPGKNWVSRWISRNKNLIDSKYLVPADLKRKKADSSYQYKLYFELLERKIAEYEIQAHNTYNLDEKGFLIGILIKLKRVFTKRQYKKGKLIGSGQDGNREWITILATICADGTSLSPGLIYQAVSGNIQDTWLQDYDSTKHNCFFASSPTGWTNDDLGYSWLTTLFDRETKTKARQGRDWRLLIVDGHGSHINMRFLDWCDAHRILVAVFPPHSTHRLQPLDVSLFAPLAIAYSLELDCFIQECQGLCGVSKRDFFRFFWSAWEKSFTKENIQSGWEKTGLHPFNPEKVLGALIESISSSTSSRPSTSSSGTSAISASDWRKIRKLFQEVVDKALTPQAKETQKLQNTILKLTTDIALLRAENAGLRNAIIHEKKKRQRGKPLFDNIRAEGDSKAIFFSPSKIQHARDLQAERERDKQQAIIQKQEDKVQRQLQKEEKRRAIEQRKQVRYQQRVAREEEARAKKLQKEEERIAYAASGRLQNNLKQKKKSKANQKASNPPLKNVDLIVAEAAEVEVVESGPSRPRRQIRPPKYLEGYDIELA